jgi:hypothetical protein
MSAMSAQVDVAGRHCMTVVVPQPVDSSRRCSSAPARCVTSAVVALQPEEKHMYANTINHFHI